MRKCEWPQGLLLVMAKFWCSGYLAVRGSQARKAQECACGRLCPVAGWARPPRISRVPEPHCSAADVRIGDSVSASSQPWPQTGHPAPSWTSEAPLPFLPNTCPPTKREIREDVFWYSVLDFHAFALEHSASPDSSKVFAASAQEG